MAAPAISPIDVNSLIKVQAEVIRKQREELDTMAGVVAQRAQGLIDLAARLEVSATRITELEHLNEVQATSMRRIEAQAHRNSFALKVFAVVQVVIVIISIILIYLYWRNFKQL